MGSDAIQLYRVKLLDSRKQDKLTYEQIIGLIRLGVIDLDDQIAPSGSEDWLYAWEFPGAFEPIVCAAYRNHVTPIRRMRRSISSGWLKVFEFREQRDQLLLSEPGLSESAWAHRPRPDLLQESAGHELYAAAAIGAARQALPQTNANSQATMVAVAAVEILRENISKILQGDLPDWADPKNLLHTASTNWLKIFMVTLCIVAVTDPLRPWIHLWWFVAVSGVYCIYAALRQLTTAKVGRAWANRFIVFLIFTIIFSFLLVVTLRVEPKHRSGVLARLQSVAALQDRIDRALTAAPNAAIPSSKP